MCRYCVTNKDNLLSIAVIPAEPNCPHSCTLDIFVVKEPINFIKHIDEPS